MHLHVGRLIHQGHHPLLHAHNPPPHKQVLTHTYTRDRRGHTSATSPVLLWFSSWLSLDATEIMAGGLVLLLGLGPSSWGTERQYNTTQYISKYVCCILQPAHRLIGTALPDVCLARYTLFHLHFRATHTYQLLLASPARRRFGTLPYLA